MMRLSGRFPQPDTKRTLTPVVYWPDKPLEVIWLLERAGERLQCEIRQAVDGDGYEMVWTQDGQTRVEHFTNADDASARRHEMETKLKLDGWSRVGRETPHPDGKRFV